jgi:hypothetical protein
MAVARRVLAGLLAVAAIVVWFALKPADGVSPTAADGQVSAALAIDQINAKTAESAPQQQVVNGWTARDLLATIARGQARQHDDRIPAELLLGVLGIALLAGTSSRRPTEVDGITSSAPAERLPREPEPVAERLSDGPLARPIH